MSANSCSHSQTRMRGDRTRGLQHPHRHRIPAPSGLNSEAVEERATGARLIRIAGCAPSLWQFVFRTKHCGGVHARHIAAVAVDSWGIPGAISSCGGRPPIVRLTPQITRRIRTRSLSAKYFLSESDCQPARCSSAAPAYLDAVMDSEATSSLGFSRASLDTLLSETARRATGQGSRSYGGSRFASL